MLTFIAVTEQHKTIFIKNIYFFQYLSNFLTQG